LAQNLHQMSRATDLTKIKEDLAQRDTQYLFDIINYAQDDYHPLIIPFIKELLIDRDLSKLEIGVADNNYHEITRRTNLDIKSKKKIPNQNPVFIWLLFIAGLVVVDILVQRIDTGPENKLVNIIAKK